MKITAILTVLVLTAGACDRAPSAPGDGGISSEQFVNAYVKLMQAQNLVGSAAEFEQRKRTVLEDLGVTEKQLQEFVQVHADDISMMAMVWDTIQTRLARISAGPSPQR